jgi:uncharacterized C2H2 Zn-finger protein
MADGLLASLNKLAQEKERLRERERKIIAGERGQVRQLDRMLSSLGYRVVADNKRRTATSLGTPKRARRKTLKCPKCDRRFSHPLPMARHMSATHGTKKTARKALPRTATKK